MSIFIKLSSILTLCMLTISACRSAVGTLDPNPATTSTQAHLVATSQVSSTQIETATQIPKPPDQAQLLATPEAQKPAAGICGRAEGDLVIVTIYPDVPDPRCVIIAPDQMLKVINSRGESIQVSLGSFEAVLDPGGEYTVNIPFGEYLAPGVHTIKVSPCCGASLWLQEEGSISPEAKLALQALTDFFAHLQAGRYKEASLLYGGTYDIMLDHNPEINPDDHEALFGNACTINGALCLNISTAKLLNQPSPTEFRFAVEFENPDGSIFALGPCCSDRYPNRQNPKVFIYTVKLDASGKFVVLEMPVYLPW